MNLPAPTDALSGCALGDVARHRAACLSASFAGGGAVLHAVKRTAALGTGGADLGTDRAHLGMEWRAAGHEGGSGMADVRAVRHQSNMVWFRMVTARADAVLKKHVRTCLRTGRARI